MFLSGIPDDTVTTNWSSVRQVGHTRMSWTNNSCTTSSHSVSTHQEKERTNMTQWSNPSCKRWITSVETLALETWSVLSVPCMMSRVVRSFRPEVEILFRIEMCGVVCELQSWPKRFFRTFTRVCLLSNSSSETSRLRRSWWGTGVVLDSHTGVTTSPGHCPWIHAPLSKLTGSASTDHTFCANFESDWWSTSDTSSKANLRISSNPSLFKNIIETRRSNLVWGFPVSVGLVERHYFL